MTWPPRTWAVPWAHSQPMFSLHDRTSGYRYSWRWSTHLLEFKLFNQADLLLEWPVFPSTTYDTQFRRILSEGGPKVATCCLFKSPPLWLHRMVLELCRGTWISISISHSWELHLCILLCFSGIQKRSGSVSAFKQGINYRSERKVFHRKLLPISNQQNLNLFIFPHQTAQSIIFSPFLCCFCLNAGLWLVTDDGIGFLGWCLDRWITRIVKIFYFCHVSSYVSIP